MPRNTDHVEDHFEWGDPPPDHSSSSQNGMWERRVRGLRDRPGEFAMVVLCDSQDTASGIVTRINQGKYKGLAKDQHEAVWAKHPTMTDKFGVWAKYIAPEPPSEGDG